MSAVINFFDSGFFQALVTLIVGFIALYIYRRQHRDDRANGAGIIYGEISTAETSLKTVRQRFFAVDSPTLENKTLMPHESWSKYKYLFKKTLTESEWEQIENFYSNCLSYDEAVRLDKSYFAMNVGPRYDQFNNHHEKLVNEFIEKKPRLKKFTEEYIKKASHYQQVFLENAGPMWYAPVKPVQDARAALVELESAVSLSSAGQKLKKIARLK